jgi:hypothetical protein
VHRVSGYSNLGSVCRGRARTDPDSRIPLIGRSRGTRWSFGLDLAWIFLARDDSLGTEDSLLHGGIPVRLRLDDLAIAEGEHVGFLRDFSSCSDFSLYDDYITVAEKALCVYRGGLLR